MGSPVIGQSCGTFRAPHRCAAAVGLAGPRPALWHRDLDGIEAVPICSRGLPSCAASESFEVEGLEVEIS
jgi:hypothetical protein